MKLIVPDILTDETVKQHIDEAKAKGMTHLFQIQDFFNSLFPSAFVNGNLRNYDSEEKKDECCVCYIMTSTTTLCGHHICRNCYNRWQNGSVNQTCPVCRSVL